MSYVANMSYAIGWGAGWIVSANPLARNETIAKIQSFAKLPSGWHYGQGGSPSRQAISDAVVWSNILTGLGFSRTDAFPGASGEILITAYHGAHQIDIIVEADLTISLTHEYNDEERSAGVHHVSVQEAIQVLGKIVGEIWSTSDFYTPGTSTQTRINLPALPSEMEMAGLQSFGGTAWLRPGQLSANTSGDIILTSGESHPFFGFSTRRSSRRVAA